jgi:hypothetical protein
VRHIFNDALARSLGPCSRAWARLASSCDAGLFFPRYGVQKWSAAPFTPCQPRRPAGPLAAHKMPQIRAALVSWTLPDNAPDTQTISPVGVARTPLGSSSRGLGFARAVVTQVVRTRRRGTLAPRAAPRYRPIRPL